jgi:probable rRNA maturation factor
MLCRVPPGLGLGRVEREALLAAILEALGFADGHIALRVVDDAEMARLNVAYLGLSGPTNVLSFPAPEDDPAFLGDIAVNGEAVAREAFLYGQEPRAYLARMLAHAVLHLAGFEHGPEMESLTEMAVASAG